MGEQTTQHMISNRTAPQALPNLKNAPSAPPLPPIMDQNASTRSDGLRLTTNELNRLRAKGAEEERESRIEEIVDKFDLEHDVAQDLLTVRGTEIVVIADDSGSMITPSVMQGCPHVKTRWDELKETLRRLLDMMLFLDEDGGFDLYFLNSRNPETKEELVSIHNQHDLEAVWRWASPRGRTPLIGTFQKCSTVRPGREKFLMVMTDGSPTDGNFKHLKRAVTAKGQGVFVNFMMCTDDDDIVDKYEDSIDAVPFVDVHDDYVSEKRQVESYGKKLSYNKFLAKCVLGARFPKYDHLDEATPGCGWFCGGPPQ